MFDPEKHHRCSIRLKGYDYSRQGAYSVTVCVQDRECLFGDMVDGEMRLNRFGEIVCRVWDGLPRHYPHVVLDAFIVMPNHVHAIMILTDETSVGAGLKPAPTRHGLPEIVRAFKTFSVRRINESRATSGQTVWQRNYYEHIIRDDAEMDRIRQYIETNPARWAEDRENPNCKAK